ncbi:MAG: fumarylacetoacetate hydrolase family protein [Alphaproteobacteria bacterium]|nr:fumarylacetoacetate hydrolase family protein [Alphaproteobacteria bacterium]
MKLASLKAGGRDGTLVVVDRILERAVAVPDVAGTLQAAVDDWPRAAPRLETVYARLNQGGFSRAFDFHSAELAAPLPRAYQWVDGSAYLHHMELVRKARGATLPENHGKDPVLYQGGSDGFLGPVDPIRLADDSWGLDFEAELAVITGDVPQGTPAGGAGKHILLLMLVNDVSLRNLIPGELAMGFGFYQSKPASAFSPVAVTPDELADAWDGGKVSLPLLSHLNGRLFGCPEAGEDLTFDFPALIAHASRTRGLSAGTIVGLGTVSNRDRQRGASCIAEKRAQEMIDQGRPETPYLRPGDRVRIEMTDAGGHTIFGAIEQRVEHFGGAV